MPESARDAHPGTPTLCGNLRTATHSLPGLDAADPESFGDQDVHLPLPSIKYMRTAWLCAAFLFAMAGVAGCQPPTEPARPAILLVDDFNAENGGVYELNYARFSKWEVVSGSVDLIGTPPYDYYLYRSQGLYVDLDGTTQEAGTLRTRTEFDLEPGSYRLEFKMAGTPRDGYATNVVTVSVGTLLGETISLASHASLSTYSATFRVNRRTSARLEFAHHGGDNYGAMLDDVRFERL